MGANKLLLGAVSPYEELLGYEYLYARDRSTLAGVSRDTFRRGTLPSHAAMEKRGIISDELYESVAAFIAKRMEETCFSVLVNGTYQFPESIGEAENPVPLLYCQGDVTLFDVPSVSIVGARKASSEGLRRASQLAKAIAEEGIVVVSGLAAGVDTAALTSAIQNSGHVIAVIGTPINEVYPKENAELQKKIAREHLLVSQVPFYKYAHQPYKSRRYYFVERNVTMAAISKATVVVEASETSGTLVQARACLKQGRCLFIMRSCFESPHAEWAERMVAKGAKILDSAEQVIEYVKSEESDGEW